MTENQMIAQEILRQINARNLMGWGVRNRVAVENGVRFDISAFGRKKHYVEVKLNGNDLYDVKFSKVVRKKDKDLQMMIPQLVELDEINDVYNDMLVEIIENKFKEYCY